MNCFNCYCLFYNTVISIVIFNMVYSYLNILLYTFFTKNTFKISWCCQLFVHLFIESDEYNSNPDIFLMKEKHFTVLGASWESFWWSDKKISETGSLSCCRFLIGREKKRWYCRLRSKFRQEKEISNENGL